MIKTAPSTDHFDVEGFVKALLTVCCGMSIGKSTWQAVAVDDSKQVGGREVKAVGVRFHRIKPRYIPKTWFGKMIQRLADALEPAVEIQPLYVHARHHRLVTEVVIGGRKFPKPVQSLLIFPFRHDVQKILGTIKKLDPVNPKIVL